MNNKVVEKVNIGSEELGTCTEEQLNVLKGAMLALNFVTKVKKTNNKICIKES